MKHCCWTKIKKLKIFPCQILIGALDWKDHSAGKEGAERYTTQNLPTYTSPGVYELGIAVATSAVIPVYLGQADNVRGRVQSYGRHGAHLQNPPLLLFSDIFSRGFPIVYRWAPVSNYIIINLFEIEDLVSFIELIFFCFVLEDGKQGGGGEEGGRGAGEVRLWVEQEKQRWSSRSRNTHQAWLLLRWVSNSMYIQINYFNHIILYTQDYHKRPTINYYAFIYIAPWFSQERVP